MTLSTIMLLLPVLTLISLSAFTIVMLAISSAELSVATATEELGGTKDENNIWN